MPIIPFITDNEENIDIIYNMANQCKVHYVLPGTLYLRGCTRKYFFDYIEKEFPQESESIVKLYKTGGAGKEYKNVLYEKVNRIRNKYKVSNSYTKPMREKLERS